MGQFIVGLIGTIFVLALIWIAFNASCYVSPFVGHSGKYVMVICRQK